MKKSKSLFLSTRTQDMIGTFLYDYISFVLFLIFVIICLVIGRPLYYLDKIIKTRIVDHLIRFFEYFAR